MSEKEDIEQTQDAEQRKHQKTLEILGTWEAWESLIFQWRVIIVMIRFV